MIIINGKQYEINPENVKVSKYDHDYCAFLKDQIEKSEFRDGIEEMPLEKLNCLKKILNKYQNMCGVEAFVAENYDKYEVKKVIINDRKVEIKYNIVEKFYTDLVRRINIRKEGNGFYTTDEESLSYKTYQSLLDVKEVCDLMLTKEKDDILLCSDQYLNMIGYEEEKKNVK